MELNPELNIRYLKHEVNQGKGAALHTGIQHASGDYIIIQDADLEYNPEEYNILLKPILDGFADEGLARKLAPSLTKNGFLYLTAKAKATKKTNTPEKQNLTVFLSENVDIIEVLEGLYED
jgi:glycosyltransferase involved in cell wall biosynthesis